MSAPADAAARERALDIRQGFIVKAPAGSGKTGLLVRRYLALLCVAEAPEEVLAVTFTRKATAELRERVMGALRSADEDPPDDPHERSMWDLARALSARDTERGWHLAEQPSRLGVYTIDGLASSLARRLPWLSGIGGAMSPVDDARPLYEIAARRTLAVLESSDDPHASPVEDMLAHLDNDIGRARQLIQTMLGRREQWLQLLKLGARPKDRRAGLEGGTSRLIASLLNDARERFPRECVPPLMHAIAHAIERLAESDAKNPLDLSALGSYNDLPSAEASATPAWQALTELLLTKAAAFRKSATKAQGFPTGTGDNKVAKADFLDVLGTLGSVDGLAESLDLLRLLPPAHYSDGQWRVLESLSQLLVRACAELRVLFAESGQCDFNELTIAAIEALGAEGDPTELALLQDLRVRHVLVDEFQDTSTSHGELVRRLVAGYSPGDGRTLFVVGDPMQSIYRFRQAEVGQFLAAWSDGGRELIDVPLECAELTVNFRSRPAVVNWLNETFSELLPERDEPQSGQVAFAAAEAQRDNSVGAGVYTHALLDATPEDEAELVVELVQAARALDSKSHKGRKSTVALLTRSRAAVMASVAALTAAGLRVRGTDLEPLDARPVVRDLVSLTRAIVLSADRLAAFSVLRAPWAGVSLVDLEALARAVPNGPLAPALAILDDVPGLTRDGYARIARVTEVLEAARQLQGRESLARRVRRAWLELGGPACVDAGGLVDADTVLALLHDFDGGSAGARLHELDASIAELYAAPASGDADVEVMTMHKSKGLEFDTVILPGLHRSPRSDDKALLSWRRLGGPSDENGLVMAPLGRFDGDGDEFAQLLTTLDKRQAQAETARLLYVACSRACERLHLIGNVKVKRDDAGEPEALASPARGSLLGLLWPRVSADFEAALEVLSPPSDDDEAVPATPVVPVLQRLPAGYALAKLPGSTLVNRPPPPPVAERVEFGWVGRDARHVGTVVHALLQQIADSGFAELGQGQVREMLPVARAELTELGVSAEGMERASSRVESALMAVLRSERAAWLFGDGHEDARNELALTAALDGSERAYAMDRTFIENTAGQRIRWIVDYKTGGHEGGNLEAFLDSEQARYRRQLENYARVMTMREALPIRLGLYFPLIDGWRSWPWVTEE